MLKLIEKYADKLVAQGLCAPGDVLMAGLNDQVVWNRSDADCGELERIMAGLNITSLLCARPQAPFDAILAYLSRTCVEKEFSPQDTETRTFLHTIPVAEALTAAEVIPLLQRRKGCVVAGDRVITTGTVSPEQAFVTFSSILFSAFVKYFVDHAHRCRQGNQDPEIVEQLPLRLAEYRRFLPGVEPLLPRPLQQPHQIHQAMIEAGRATVSARLVDSFFGNLSCFAQGAIHISQTGSSLDELRGCIDICPLDNSTCTGLTASSELVAHRDIYRNGEARVILHGHPKFSVILSMLCFDAACTERGRCHIHCKKPRFIGEIPIVPGEVGTGPRGLSRTLPPAVRGRAAAVVFGHGVFALGEDFSQAFDRLRRIEAQAFDAYLALPGIVG